MSGSSCFHRFTDSLHDLVQAAYLVSVSMSPFIKSGLLT